MGEEQIKAIAASAYIPINAINPIMNYNNPEQAKIRAAQEFSRAFTARIYANIDGYNERMAQFRQNLAEQEKKYSQDQIQKRYSEITSLDLESTTDPKKIEYGLGILGNLFRYNQFHKTNSFTNDLVYNQKLIRGKAEKRLAQLKQGEDVQNGPKSYWGLGFESNSIKQTTKNVAAFEFQKTGERDFLS